MIAHWKITEYVYHLGLALENCTPCYSRQGVASSMDRKAFGFLGNFWTWNGMDGCLYFEK